MAALASTSSESTHIVAICGSLRLKSTNLGLLRALAESLPAGVTMDIIVPGDLPLFNQDIENEPNAAVAAYRARVKSATSFLFAACEYNFSISGAMKNAIDWASRGPDGNLFNDKPAAVISAGGGAGGLRAQNHIRDIAVFLNLHMLNHPSVQLRIFDQPNPVDFGTGNLVSSTAQEGLTKFFSAFLAWSSRINSSRV